MAATGRQFVVELITKTKNAEKGLEDFGKAFDRFKVPVLAGLAAVAAGVAAITTAAYRAGSALVEIGNEFNNAYRTLRAGTGATGEELARLEQSFRNVFGTGSDAMEDVAATMVQLDRRFDGLSNLRLERLTRQFLDLGGLLGEDTVGLVDSIAAAFNRFDVPARDASETLDTLFRISQETGYSLSQLGGQTANYGVGLQRLGFNLNEAAAFLALLEREGVAASRIFPSLNTAAGKMAREGVGDVVGGIADLIHQLQTLDEAEANAKAVEMLGADYGNFLEVVRSTNFDFRGLLDTLGDSTGVISDTATETDGLAEKWDMFKNFLKVELEPIATEVFGVLASVVDELRPAAERVMEAYGTDGLAGALEVVRSEWTRIYDQYLEPLWLRFLTFLREVIMPAALDLGRRIGGVLMSGIGEAIRAGLDRINLNLFDIVLPGSPTSNLLRSLANLDLSGGLQFGGDESVGLVPGLRYVPGQGYVRVPTGPAEMIPGLADGGVVMSPTLALVGEAGPEAVIPLSQMNEYGGATVNVYVTSADPNAVVDAIRRYTRTNGPLGRVVSV